MSVLIRPARCGDAGGIARVHVDAWRSTYGGVVPESYLARLSVERRLAMWRRTLCEPDGSTGEFVYVAESSDGEIVGFASGGAEREGNREFSGELYAIYLLESAQRQGLGRQLALAVASGLAERSFDGMLLWVLADNPIGRGFYERLGGKLVGEKEIVMDDVALVEVAYGWRGEALERLVSASRTSAL